MKKPGRPQKFTAIRRAAFLVSLRTYGLLKRAAEAVGVSYRTVRSYVESDPEFASQVAAADEAGVDDLEMKATDVALKGDGPMLRFLLACKRPEKFSQRYQLEHGGSVDVTGNVTVTVVEDEKWYGNNAHDKAAKGVASSTRSVIEPSEVQGGGMRAAMGQNGHGPDGRR
ncbi:MAG: hypothetical protein L0211_24815 [Planctomycetaceae bacterium]|nr:hypothetical protein [Planctomycetaceae bacterium]